MTEQEREEIRRLFEKDPVGVIAAARKVLGTTPDERRLWAHDEADMRCAVELAASDPPSPPE